MKEHRSKYMCIEEREDNDKKNLGDHFNLMNNETTFVRLLSNKLFDK